MSEDSDTSDEPLEELRERKRAAARGGEDRIEAQHDHGKKTARERIDYTDG